MMPNKLRTCPPRGVSSSPACITARRGGEQEMTGHSPYTCICITSYSSMMLPSALSASPDKNRRIGYIIAERMTLEWARDDGP